MKIVRNYPAVIDRIKTAIAVGSYIESDNDAIIDGVKQSLFYQTLFINVQQKVLLNKNVDSDGNNISYNYFICHHWG